MSFLLQNIEHVLLEHHRRELIDKLLAIRSSMRQFNHQVDTFWQMLLQYTIIQDALGIPGPSPPESIPKVGLKNKEAVIVHQQQTTLIIISKFC